MSIISGLGKEIIHRYVFELRFDFGELYFDRAGRTLREILSTHEGWDYTSVTLNLGKLIHKELNLAFNFNSKKLDFSQSQSEQVVTLMPVNEFGKLAEHFTQIVTNTLDLRDVTRLGFRAWFLRGTGDKEEAGNIIHKLNAIRFDPLIDAGLGEIKEPSYQFVVDRDKHMMRVSVSSFEQEVNLPSNVILAAKMKVRNESKDQRKKLLQKMKAEKQIASYPFAGVLVDLDAYIEDPIMEDKLSVSDFIHQAWNDFDTIKSIILAPSSKKRTFK